VRETRLWTGLLVGAVGDPAADLCLAVGLAALAGLFIIQIMCVHGGVSMMLYESVSRPRCALAVLVLDLFLYSAPMFAAHLVSAAAAQPTGFMAALVTVAVMAAFLWTAVWIAGRLFSTSMPRAFAALLVGSMLSAVVMLVIWGIAAAIAALISGRAGGPMS